MTCFGGGKTVIHVIICALLLCAGCSSAETLAVPAAPAAAPTSQPQERPAAAVPRPPDPPAPPTHVPVIRKGKKAKHTVVGGPGGFAAAQPVKYRDGVSVQVSRIGHGTEEGQGPGTFTGRQHTSMAITVTNGSRQPLDLTQVVVTTMYGVPARIAPPAYDDLGARDFTGAVAAGASASATYLFAIPPEEEAGKVVTVVDFDDVHTPAVFKGTTK